MTRANPLQGEPGRRLARLAREAGCKRVFLGLESMNNDRLEMLGKKANACMNREAVLNLHHADVEVSAAWIIGLPRTHRPFWRKN